MNLRERTKQLSNNLPLMENRKKGELNNLIGTTCTIDDFGFLQDEQDKEYVVFTIKEDNKNFYFGGSVLTQDMLELEADGYRTEIQKEGLPIMLESVISKKNRVYTKVTYYPN